MRRALNEQVVVITGASSGIGRETALLFGRNGASVVLAARGEAALQNVAHEIEQAGGKAHVVVTDVAEPDQVERLVQEAISRFGRIDTWVNNAAVTVYGKVEDQTLHDIERTIQVDLMGQIYGMKAVLPRMIEQGEGAIINVSSVEGRRAVPFHSAYAAAKHGVNAFSDALRMELERDHPGITVTVVMPASINTPFFDNARSRMGVRPKPLPPVYEPIDVAQAIVSAAVTPQREIYVGSGAKVLSSLHAFSPALVDRLMLAGDAGFKLQQDDKPVDHAGNLDEPSMGAGQSTGSWSDMSRHSIYTRLFETMNPNSKRLMTLALGVGAIALMRRSKSGGDGHERHYYDAYYDNEPYVDEYAYATMGYEMAPYPQAEYDESWQYPGEPPIWEEPGYGPPPSY